MNKKPYESHHDSSHEPHYEPPFTMNNHMVERVAQASYELGRVSALLPGDSLVHLRRRNRIRTVHSSLAIEANTLTLEQVTAILDGKRVRGSAREIREVQNAFRAYELLGDLDPLEKRDMLRAHAVMMSELIEDAGEFRSQGVGIFDGTTLLHMAPPANLVSHQISELLDWYGHSTAHPLIKSAVFHYEFEFIHPFQDGNGRMGRLWHTALLGVWNPLFHLLPVEELIQTQQQDYYATLREADHKADATPFVEFMLDIFVEALIHAADASVSEEAAEKDAGIALADVKEQCPKLAEVGRSWPKFGHHLADVVDQLSVRHLRTLESLADALPHSTAEIAQALGESPRTIRRDLRILAEHGLVLSRGETSARSYCLNIHCSSPD